MTLSKIDPDGLNIGQIGGRRNIIINGDLKISQRGDFTSATALPSDAYYGVDRWKMWDINVSSTFTHTKNVTVNGLNTNSLKMQATSSATGRLLCRQIIERDPNSSYLQSYGQEMTFSVWMKSNSSNARPIIFDPTTDASAWIFGDSHTGGGDWEKLTVQYTGGTTSAASSHIEISCNISSNTNGNVSISSGDYIEIAFAQFEVGDTATPFEHRSYGEELALCQRYYQLLPISYGNSGFQLMRGSTSSGASETTYYFNGPEMRARPSFTQVLGSNLEFAYRPISGASGSGTLRFTSLSGNFGASENPYFEKRAVRIRLITDTSGTTLNLSDGEIFALVNNSGAIVVDADAEL